MRIVALLISLVLIGCGGNSGTSIFFADVSGVTPAGVSYSGRKCTFLESGAEYYSVVIVAQGNVIKVASSSATGMSVRLASNKEVEAVFGQSTVVAGSKTETLQNGLDYEATINLLEQGLDRLLTPEADQHNKSIDENGEQALPVQK